MTDPFSITTGVLGILASLTTLSIRINEFRHDFAESAREIDRLTKEVDDLTGVLRQLQADRASLILPSDLSQNFGSVLQALNRTVLETELLLKRSFQRRFRAVSWALSGKKNCIQLCQCLESYKSTVGLILTLSSVTIGQGLDERTNQILFEIRRLRVDSLSGENIILQRFLEETEAYAETVRGSSTVTERDNTEDIRTASATSASESDEFLSARTIGEPNDSEEPRSATPPQDIDRPNDQGQTCLHLALTLCKGSDKPLIAMLLRGGASLTARDNRGRTALDYASDTAYHSIITMILDAEFAGPLINGATELHRAAYLGDISRLSRLLRQQNPPNVNAKDDRGLTPLHLACQSDREDVVIFLLDHGADCKIASRNWGFPLGQVSWQGMQNATGMMLKIGADVHAAKPGWTPFRLAVLRAHDDVCRLLKEWGACPSTSVTSPTAISAF